ncbi:MULTISPECIES: LamB/YcsF family protein [Anoxybacillaceae]|nr:MULTISPECIES: LamB/YcsF family protein [Anoxybacillus]MCZ0756913.1 LamB/YcsF family protein [Anoxybacillus sp. J5B_2022]
MWCAHPGFSGLLGLGSRNMSVTPDEVYACVVYQNGKTSFTIIRERRFAF